MKKFSVCVESKEYRYIEVEAEDENDAKDKAWDVIENTLNQKPQDYDTEIFVEWEVNDATA